MVPASWRFAPFTSTNKHEQWRIFPGQIAKIQSSLKHNLRTQGTDSSQSCSHWVHSCEWAESSSVTQYYRHADPLLSRVLPPALNCFLKNSKQHNWIQGNFCYSSLTYLCRSTISLFNVSSSLIAEKSATEFGPWVLWKIKNKHC